MANQDQSNPSQNTERNSDRIDSDTNRGIHEAEREGNLGSERNRASDESVRNRSDEGDEDDLGSRPDRSDRSARSVTDRMDDSSTMGE
jgi:hypothetical protein